MEIREFQMADYEKVVTLWERAGLSTVRSDQRDEIRKKLLRDPDLFLVGVEAQTVVAAVIGGYDGRRGWAYHLAVEPEHHAQGRGSALLGALESRLRNKGCLKLNLLIDWNNAGVAEFYRRCGYSADESVFLMDKWLA